MNKFGLFAVLLLLSGIGSAYNITKADKSTNCTCLKIIYLGPDGKNLTIDIYDPACNCSASNTVVSYMD
jgi:hypothetical protein